jgi:hypothetical protein
MNEDIIDEIFNDEAKNITTKVEVPLGYGRVIVCKTTMVDRGKQLIHKMAVALGHCLPSNVEECKIKENGVFVIVVDPMGKVRKTNIRALQDALQGTFHNDLSAGGFVEIQVYRDVYIYKEEGRVEVDECIFNDTVSHEKPLKDDFAEILTREYEPTPEKMTVDIPQLVF